MTKAETIDLLKMLSAIEAWSFTVGSTLQMPDYLSDQLNETIVELTDKVLES